MIVDAFKLDVFNTSCKHIAYAISTEGTSRDSGYTRDVVEHMFGLDVEKAEELELGDVVNIIPRVDTKYYGLVCYSPIKGWDYTAKAITDSLDKIEIPESETIAVVMLETGFTRFVDGYYAREIVQAIHFSQKKCIVYSGMYTKEEIFKQLI